MTCRSWKEMKNRVPLLIMFRWSRIGSLGVTLVRGCLWQREESDYKYGLEDHTICHAYARGMLCRWSAFGRCLGCQWYVCRLLAISASSTPVPLSFQIPLFSLNELLNMEISSKLTQALVKIYSGILSSLSTSTRLARRLRLWSRSI